MLLLITKKATEQNLKKAAADFAGYIKVVVDIEQKILAAGGKKHFDAEQLLLEHGSNQKDLWGGGIDLETKEIDYDSMINLRPSMGNASREVLSEEIRKQMDTIMKNLLE